MEAKLDEKGFTLIEMLLVLSILMVMTSSVIFASTNRLAEIEGKRFFRQFHLDIQRLQTTAIVEEKYAYIRFSENGTKYIASSANAQLFEYNLPSGISLSKESSLKGVTFHPNGSVQEFGKLLFETKKGIKQVTIYIGKGKLNYEE